MTPSDSNKNNRDEQVRAAVGYVRVSSAEQEAFSPANQRREIEQYTALNRWTLLKIVQETASGKDMLKRVEIRKLLVEMKNGRPFNVLVIARLDRLARSARDLLNIVHDLQAAGVALVSVRESIDLTSPAGKAMLGMMAVFAQFESDMNSLRQRIAYAARRAKGNAFANRPPYGLMRDPADKSRVIVHPERMGTVREIFALRRKGRSPYEIAGELNAAAILSPFGRQWTDTTIKQILGRRKLYDEYMKGATR